MNRDSNALCRELITASYRYTGTLTRSDMEVDSRTWTTCIVGKVSEWLLDPLSSPDPTLRLAGEAALKQVGKTTQIHYI